MSHLVEIINGGGILKVRQTDREYAIVCLSGGQDSATCLAWAKERFKKIFSVCFFYMVKGI